MANDQRPNNREVENEDLRPAGEGQPPRPATEPKGAEPHQTKTMTDPATGAPNPDRPEGRSGGTYAQEDQSEAAQRSKSRQDHPTPKTRP